MVVNARCWVLKAALVHNRLRVRDLMSCICRKFAVILTKVRRHVLCNFAVHCMVFLLSLHTGVVDQLDDDDDGGEWEKVQGNKRQRSDAGNNEIRGGGAGRIVYKRRHQQPMTEAEWLAVEDVWALSLVDRWRLYNCWASQFCQQKSAYIRTLSAQYNRYYTPLSCSAKEND